MAKYLLDTNACITIRNHLKGFRSKDAARQAAHDKLIARWKAMPAADLAMSLFVLGELRVWVESHDDPAGRAAAEAWTAELVGMVGVLHQPGDDPAAGGPDALAHHYADIRNTLEKQNQGLADNDLWIAAHARAHQLTVVSNDAHFKRVPGLTTENWTV